jgi:hypothetical protein
MALLDGSEEPYDPQRATVNFDETSKPLIAQARAPLPAQPGQPERYASEYMIVSISAMACATCLCSVNPFLFYQPQTGWRHIALTQQRTRQDWAQQMTRLGAADEMVG